jgi:hypothetical protein
MKTRDERYRYTGLLVMLLASSCHLVTYLIFWEVTLLAARESTFGGAFMMGLLVGLPPFVVVGITWLWLPLGSMIAILLSLSMMGYWIHLLTVSLSAVALVLSLTGIPLALAFLTGGILVFIASLNLRQAI